MLDSPGLPALAIEVDQLHKRGRYEELSIKCKSTNTLAARLRTAKETRQQSEENGGEPTIDKHFTDAYQAAFDLGMMLTVSTNGSRLWHPALLDLFAARPPYRLVVSLYGATEAAYDGLTRRRGSYKAFRKGIAAATEAGLPLRLNIVVTDVSAAETRDMIALAEGWGLPHNLPT